MHELSQIAPEPKLGFGVDPESRRNIRREGLRSPRFTDTGSLNISVHIGHPAPLPATNPVRGPNSANTLSNNYEAGLPPRKSEIIIVPAAVSLGSRQALSLIIPEFPQPEVRPEITEDAKRR